MCESAGNTRLHLASLRVPERTRNFASHIEGWVVDIVDKKNHEEDAGQKPCIWNHQLGFR